MAETLHLWRNARIAACDAAMARFAPGALLTRGPRIEWVGAERDLPAGCRPDESHDLGGAWVTPGLIDCHTHLVFAGTRAGEYAERLLGRSYQEIARAGGGILSSMRAVRAASEQQLFDESLPRLESLLAEGVTTVEIKSGYGLTLKDEAKMLRVARSLARALPVTVTTTLLAAHAVPPEYAGRPDAYIDEVAAEWLPTLHSEGLVDAVDIFCENVGFSVKQAEKLFASAARLGVPVKMHAEQLSNLGGSLLAARHGALSCDHLEYATAAEAQALAGAGTVAVLLPVAFFCLAQEHEPPVAALRSAGTGIAIATDCNPGSAPGSSLLLAMSMATRLFGLTCEEALAGATRHAARALGMQEERGTLAAGKAADFIVWRIGELEELGYWSGFNPCRSVVKAGRLVS
ncbi:MAG: imidazolonepropionase [Gammaproteobacteria bacterium]|nr:imidazolonepropionase [Gammaproteobacteria bacterium]MDE2263269.1 imidazolonepropionase [Gammaproteobacteria bacterium]